MNGDGLWHQSVGVGDHHRAALLVGSGADGQVFAGRCAFDRVELPEVVVVVTVICAVPATSEPSGVGGAGAEPDEHAAMVTTVASPTSVVPARRLTRESAALLTR